MIDKDIHIRIKNILVWCSENLEANANCLRDSSFSDGEWMEDEDRERYEYEMGKVFEMDDLLKHISADLQEDK